MVYLEFLLLPPNVTMVLQKSERECSSLLIPTDVQFLHLLIYHIYFVLIDSNSLLWSNTSTRPCSEQYNVNNECFVFPCALTRTISKDQTMFGKWRRKIWSTTSPLRICGSIILRAAHMASVFPSVSKVASSSPSILFPTYRLFRYTPARHLLSPGSSIVVPICLLPFSNVTNQTTQQKRGKR